MTREEKAEKVLQIVEKFVQDQNISSDEMIYQSDHVILNAYEFIYDLCEVAGYYEYKDGS